MTHKAEQYAIRPGSTITGLKAEGLVIIRALHGELDTGRTVFAEEVSGTKSMQLSLNGANAVYISGAQEVKIKNGPTNEETPREA